MTSYMEMKPAHSSGFTTFYNALCKYKTRIYNNALLVYQVEKDCPFFAHSLLQPRNNVYELRQDYTQECFQFFSR